LREPKDVEFVLFPSIPAMMRSPHLVIARHSPLHVVARLTNSAEAISVGLSSA
jgi:hypothetical protein